MYKNRRRPAGASEGAGLGNAFLSHIQAVDGLFHVVRCFDDPDAQSGVLSSFVRFSKSAKRKASLAHSLSLSRRGLSERETVASCCLGIVFS